jgi:mRNA interferase RelE/StbE
LAWTIEVTATALKEIKKLGPQAAKLIFDFLERRLSKTDDPGSLGEELKHELAGLWRYRVGDWRLICEFQEKSLLVLVLRAGHRREVYKVLKRR